MTFLAIDTSTDETSVAVTRDKEVLANIISSQVDEHSEFGGVVPFLAQRLHRERIDAVVELALRKSGLKWNEIDAIAVTYGPGLAPALQVGIEKAIALSEEQSKSLYVVNHMAGHIASCFTEIEPEFPLMALLLSGGHTELVLARSFGDFTLLGQTLDDALGEAYDKVARMLGLGYPGGRKLAERAALGNSHAYELPVPMVRSGDLNFSYSGLKNAVRLLVLEQAELTDEVINDIAACFERVAQESILRKVEKALQMQFEVKQLAFGGGVAANTVLRRKLATLCDSFGVSLLIPQNMQLCTDNAAMIGLAAWYGIQVGQKPVTSPPDRIPYLTLEDTNFTPQV